MSRNESKSTRDYPDAVFLGSIEVVSFLFLFLSPFLNVGVVRLGWTALVLWRVAALGGVLYYGVPDRLRFLGSSLLYGLPFWVSSVLFPVTRGQEEAIGQVLVGYLILLCALWGLSFLKTHWYPGLLGFLSFAFLYQDAGSVPWLGAGAGLVAFWPQGHADRPYIARNSLRAVAFAAGAGWAFCLYLAVVGRALGLMPLALGLLHWGILLAATTDVLSRAQEEDRERPWAQEAELALPSLRAALSWNYSRKLLRRWLPWMIVAVWAPFVSLGLVMGLAVLAALPGMVYLAANRCSEGGPQWFVCWHFMILWAMAESPAQFVPGILLVAVLTSLFLRVGKEKSPKYHLSYCPNQAGIEEMLRTLRQPAPVGFSGEVMRVLEPSVDLDSSSLSAQAPQGFRQRLLERLRQDKND